jgi:hypothetical protein
MGAAGVHVTQGFGHQRNHVLWDNDNDTDPQETEVKVWQLLA